MRLMMMASSIRESMKTMLLNAEFIWFQDNVTLEKLNLQGNWIEGEGGLAMARMLEDNDYITEIVRKPNSM